MNCHLVTGVGGQDGFLLARALTSSGHTVIGTSQSGRDLSGRPVERLDITDASRFAEILRMHRPQIVHHLAGKSSVGQSWREPQLSDLVNRKAVEGMLMVLNDHPGIVFLQASSAEIFSDATGRVVSETTPLDPQSPYAEAKARAHVAVQQARTAGLRASNVILFGHTSEFQPRRFAIPSVCAGAVEVAQGLRAALPIQNPAVRRDWGSARDHVRAFLLAADVAPDDFVIGTGALTSLGDIATWALDAAGASDSTIEVTGTDRPIDHDGIVADSTRAARVLGWEPAITLREEIERMVRSRL